MSRTKPGGARFQIGEYYLDCPHPNRGGSWYACRYDAGARTVRRRSLDTADFEAAKIALAALVATAPQGSPQAGPPGAGQVLTIAALRAYMDDRGQVIASEEQAEIAVTHFANYVETIGRIDAPVSFWTPAQQFACAAWLRETHGHSAAYIARLFNVLRSAFLDAARVKLRHDPAGGMIEAALLTSPPEIVARQDAIAGHLGIPARRRRKATVSLDQMADVLDAIGSEHLFRFAILSLCTWARPQAIIDFDQATQVDWHGLTLDLAPPGWRPTKKRRPCQPLTQCAADWLIRWQRGDEAQIAAEKDEGRPSAGLPLRPTALLVYKHARVATTRKAWRRIGAELGLDGFSQYSFRHFMADQVRILFRGVAREHRSLWLGHVVRDGSRTTDHYESDDPLALADVALAVDCILNLLAERCSRPLFAIEVRLNRADLEAIGARAIPKNAVKSGKNGGRDRDRTCDPYHVKVVRVINFPMKSAKKRA